MNINLFYYYVQVARVDEVLTSSVNATDSDVKQRQLTEIFTIGTGTESLKETRSILAIVEQIEQIEPSTNYNNNTNNNTIATLHAKHTTIDSTSNSAASAMLLGIHNVGGRVRYGMASVEVMTGKIIIGELEDDHAR